MVFSKNYVIEFGGEGNDEKAHSHCFVLCANSSKAGPVKQLK